MTAEQWLDSIESHLYAGRPIIFAGYQSSGGHAFVVDGYDAFDRVHVNWGWGGFGDGYFTLSPLPMYSAGCQAIVGIQPDGVLYGNKNFLNVDENGSDDTITIFTNNLNSASWIAYTNRQWITVNPASGTGAGASATIAIHVDSNQTGENRSGNVIVKQGTDSINIPIIQYGYHGEDQILPDDDTITMQQLTSGDIQVDTIYPGVHYTILDPGGTGPYPTNCNARHHLVSSQRSYLIVNVDYDIQQGSDWLRIYDSDGENVQLTNYSGTDSNQRIVCYSGHAFLSFHSDTYTPRDGFAIHVYACDTFEAEVRNIVSVVSGTNTITLSWIDTSSADQWRIKWGTDYRHLDQYREVTEQRAVFTNLDLENNQYYFRIYNNAGAADTGNECLSRLAMGMGNSDCPGSSITDVELVQVLNHSVTIRWNDLSTSDGDPMHWKVRYGINRDSLDLLAETDTNCIRLTGLDNGTTYYYRIYNNTVSTDSASICFLMPVQQFETLLCLWDSMDIRNVTTYNESNTSLDVGWEDFGGGTHWTLRLFRNNTTIDYPCDTPYVHIDGLQRGHQYDIVIYNNTGQTDTMECQQHWTITTPCESVPGQCVNFADLTTCLVQPWTGTYDNPHIWLGCVDNGPSNATSRHTVNHINEPDPRTGGALMRIPPGETASVRLGNWLGGAESESISYLYDVDTTVFDLLILKYAAVLENPDHTPDEQPRFTLHIVDEFDVPIDDNCYLFDFVSDTALGWNVYNHVLWKDWTTIGVDLAPLHGQRIKVELTTYDCNQGNHFGYAYYVLRCANKEITAEMCGSSLHNTFHVPEGFAYRWFESSNPTATLSTTSTLTVDTAGDYRCLLSPVGSTSNSCSFEMRCQAGYRFPHSRFSYVFADTTDNCLQRINFTNLSRVTTDPDHQLPNGETISDVVWDFGDGSSSSDTDPSHLFTHGEHIVTLYCWLNSGACIDTLADTIIVGPVCPTPDTVFATICEGDTHTFFDMQLTAPGVYDYHDGLWWHTIVLTVHPDSYASVSDTIVQNSLPYSFIDTVFTQASLDTLNQRSSHFSCSVHLLNHLGCDSIVDFSLTVWHNRTSSVDTMLCPEFLPLQWNGITSYDTGSFTAHLFTTHGADSMAHIHLGLNSRPKAAMEISPTKVNMENYNNIVLKDISNGNVTRTWYLPDVVDNRAVWTYSYPIPLDSVEVLLVAASSDGCIDSTTGTIFFLNSTFYAPNIFTPDEMGNNDPSHPSNNRFQIVGSNLIDLEVFIYNRWGEMICSFKGNDGFWDGTYRGQPCPQGAYVWLARFYTSDAPKTQQVRKGSVLLIR
jgi:gliding motility-associated-like protein